MSANRNLAPGVDTTLLNTHFAVVTDSVGALRFPVKSNKFLPTVNLVRSFSYFYGFTSQTILPSVTFSYLGTWDLRMNMTVFVPFTTLIPWANCPNSFAKDLSQISSLGILSDACIPGPLQKFDGWLNWLHGFFGIVMSMHNLAGDFSCLLISNWNLDIPCPPSEVAQFSPLVVG